MRPTTAYTNLDALKSLIPNERRFERSRDVFSDPPTDHGQEAGHSGAPGFQTRRHSISSYLARADGTFSFPSRRRDPAFTSWSGRRSTPTVGKKVSAPTLDGASSCSIGVCHDRHQAA
jgi:hypothetical protein